MQESYFFFVFQHDLLRGRFHALEQVFELDNLRREQQIKREREREREINVC